MVAYTKPQQRRKKEEVERVKGERDQIEFIDLRLERWQLVRFRKASRRDKLEGYIRNACHLNEMININEKLLEKNRKNDFLR